VHAHVNIWKLNDAGTSSSDGISSQIGKVLKEQPGFHSYTLIRTDEHEVVAVTLFETSAQLHDALEMIDKQVLENMRHVAHGKPVRRAGDVVFHVDVRDGM
jgi:hypothetical protein